jgi:hypothetical protein
MEEIKTQLFARIACKNDKHKIIFTSKNDIEKTGFFNVPDIEMDKTIEFNAENARNLEEDEWFFIELDDEHKSMIQPYVSSAASTADLNPITADDYMAVEAIYKVIKGESNTIEIIFQKITKTNKIVSKRFLLFGDHPEIQEQKNSIEFSTRQDAYFDGHNKIYFKKFSSIRSLFEGIEDYYREATDKEVKQIRNSKLLEISDGIKIGIRNRKKIATLLNDDSIKLDDKSFQDKLRKCASKYSEAGFKIDGNGKFIITNDRELGIFLSLAGGRFYTSEMTGDKMEAHEVSKLKTK